MSSKPALSPDRGRVTVALATLLAVIGTACSERPGREVEPSPERARRAPEIVRPRPEKPNTCEEKRALACSPAERLIGIKDYENTLIPATAGAPEIPYGKACEPVAGYSESQLFRSGVAPEAIPLGLRRFCLYVADPNLPVPGEPPQLPNETLVKLEVDCRAVGPSAPLMAGVETYLDDRFYAEAGAIAGVAAGNETPVRLVFLDTGRTNEHDPHRDVPGPCGAGDDGRACSPHGYSLVNMARGLLCDRATGPVAGARGCGGVRIASRLAMPYVQRGGVLEARPVGGGTVGFLSDLAQEIEKEVTRWWWTPDPPGERLILNLSLGWEPCVGGYEFQVDVDAERMPARAQAVHAALQDASCRGALVVSAAGNFAGLPDRNDGQPMVGPLLPAAWERLPGPPSAFAGPVPRLLPAYPPLSSYAWSSCGNALYPDSAPSSYSEPNFVYAAAAVRADSRPLVNSRPKSFREFAAFGDHAAVSWGSVPADSTAVLTGTSVAATIVSATAAARWSRAPATTPTSAGEVMEAIHASGEPLTPPTGPVFVSNAACTSSSDCQVRRVRLCQALALPCAAGPRGEFMLGSPAGTTATKVTLPSPGFATAPLASPCRGEHPQLGSVAPCTQWQFTALTATPWGGPQPGDNPCPTCSTKPGSSALLIDMNPDFTIGGITPTFSDLSLVIGRDVADVSWDENTESRIYPLSVPGLAPGSSAVVCLKDSPVAQFLNRGDDLALSMTAEAAGEARAILVPVLRFSAADPEVGALCP